MENPKITIIDYGVGNLYSLKRAFNFLGIDSVISEDAFQISNSDAVVLPGVGAFAAGMRGLERRGLVETVKTFAAEGKPMLGICLGAQLMLSAGYEFGEHNGLGLIPGKVLRFPALFHGEKIPQIGWNGVRLGKGTAWDKTIFNSLPDNFSAYFVHSYYLAPEADKYVLSSATYGDFEFCSAVFKGNVYGCQFHPEKSGKIGLEVLKNFINISRSVKIKL